MAYTNAIFYINLYSGSDAARTALTSCTASNPSGTITRITKTAHGLVTGAVVDLTLFTTWLNAAWKITVVDANNFDLDGAVWQATADASGTVTPRGGSSWADAWLTITTGATAARIAAGDVIRISKTPDPVAIGNATWTDGSPTVTLATAQTANVEYCEVAWTASTNVTCTTSANRKQGSLCASVAIAAAFTTGKVAYRAIGSTLNLSSYQKISFWLQNSVAITAGYLKLCLCSDTTGTTIVDEFVIPAIPSTTRYLPLTIARTGGGNLGSSIQSVALYAVTDPGTPTLLIDNIIACTIDGLSLQELISKNGAAQGGTEGYYAIQSIDGTTIRLDGDTNCYASATWNKYGGTTETVATYMRTTFKTAMAASSTSAVHTINQSGSATAYVEYQGGYEIGTTNQNGETFFDGLNGNGYGVNIFSKNYVKLNRLNGSRFYCSVYFSISHNNIINTITNVNNNANYGVYLSTSHNNVINTITNVNNNANNGVYFSTSHNNRVKVVNSTSGTGFYSDSGVNYFINSTFNQTTEFTSTTGPANNWVWSKNHDNIEGNDWGFTYQATVNWQTAITQNGIGSQKIAITGNTRTTIYPVKLALMQVAAKANKLVTVKASVKKDHATNVACRLIVYDDNNGVTEAYVTKASDTDWEQLTLTFTPTKTGVYEIYLESWYVAGTGNIYVERDDVTQEA